MAGDWRERFLELEQQAESASEAHQQAERELTRLVTRICVACSGFDPQLDTQLDRLRKVARKGRADALIRQSEEFADSIVHAAEDRFRPGVLARLLEHAGQDEKQVQATMKLWSDVAADPVSVSDAKLDRLAKALALAPQAAPATGAGAAPAPAPGLLGRLIGRQAAPAPGKAPARALLEVLGQVAWPTDMAEQVKAYHQRLEQDPDGDTWVEIVHEIGDLAVRALSQAQADARSTEHFLTQLNQRLEELDRHMLDEGQRREDSRHSGDRLGQQMSTEVSSLTESVRSSASLEDLQASVIASLDRIHGHVREHLDDENRRRESAEAEAEQLRARMHHLEQNSYDLQRQVAQTQREAMRDALTGLPNRRAYDEQLAQEFARWKRFGEPLAMLVLDVDNFKQVNDQFGHKSGDKALTMIARVLGEKRRETDLVARLGGEEFVVLLPGAPAPDALRIADDMRVAVANCGLHANKQPVAITVSGGLAMFAAGDTPEQVFERADRALYRAKGNGKNRIDMAESDQ
ncbi:MAG: diguanylate cyclase [Gammaproteobacteria bacterium]|nr:diguanylate cyclase [Gammaproteobacteria bacterium]